MKEHPILFTGAMVRAILEGRKTQTRRPIKPQPPASWQPTVGTFHPTKVNRKGVEFPGKAMFGASDEAFGCRAPFAVGDRLWVRETWTVPPGSTARAEVVYRADDEELPGPWTPSIHMPRWVSRITLEVTNVRPERIQSISEVGAKAEGVEKGMTAVEIIDRTAGLPRRASYRSGFELLWDSIYGSTAFAHGPLEWESNPWVWATTFKVVTP